MNRKLIMKKNKIFLVILSLNLIIGSFNNIPSLSIYSPSVENNFELNKPLIDNNQFIPSIKESNLMELGKIERISQNQDINGSFNEKLALINPIPSSRGLTGYSTRIVIIDTGINDTAWINSEKIINRTTVIPNGTVVDNKGHGSAVASIISKIAPNAELISIKVIDNSGIIKREYIEEAFLLAQSFNASIVHASLGSRDIAAVDHNLIENLVEQNISLIFSAGNEGPFASSITSPAVFSESIAVGMAYNKSIVFPGSSVGPRPSGTIGPDVVAPGVYIPSYTSLNDANNYTGTSFATPFVTGTIALLQEAFPNSNPAILKGALLDSAQFMNNTSPVQQGNGLIDMNKTYNRLANIDTLPLLVFTPKGVSSNYRFFGHSINGLTHVYRLGLYSSINCTILMNSTNILPIEANITNNIPFISIGYNSVNLTISIPEHLKMEKRSGNIEFNFSKIVGNHTDVYTKNFSVDIANRYPGGKTLFFQGFDNDSFIPDGPTGTFSQLRLFLEKYMGIQVSGAIRSTQGMTITDPLIPTYNPLGSITTQDLANYDLLVLADVEFSISDEEIEIIQKWVEEGHSLLIMSYPSWIEGQTQLLSNAKAINSLLQPYGMAINDDITKPDFGRFSEATTSTSTPIFGLNEFTFDYNGTTIEISSTENTHVLATATDLISGNKEVNVASYWEDPNTKGKIVVFGGLQPFSDLKYTSENLEDNIAVIANIFDWFMLEQGVPIEVIVTSNPTVGTSTQIQITVLDQNCNVNSFNGTILESNGSYSQIVFKRSINTYIGNWIPKIQGIATLWLDLQFGEYSPTNGVYSFEVYDAGTQSFFLIFLIGGFVLISIGYYWISSRRNKSQIPLQQQLALRYKREQEKAGSKTIESLEICPRCRTPRFDQSSKYCFKCGREL